MNVTVEEDVGIVITVPSDFTGNVTVNVSGIKYNDDVIPLINIGKFEEGSYTANVTFYGDNNYNNKSITVRFNVTRVIPVINVTIDDTTYPGKAVAHVNVTGASGVINITVDGKVFNGTLVNGVATIELTGLSGGVKEALVNFTTSDKYNFNATTKAKFTVYRNASSIIDIVKENEKDVVAHVTPGTTGNVTFYINGKKLNATIDANGVARLTGVLRTGENNVVVVYTGDINYTGSQASQNITTGKQESLINVTATSVVYGNDSVITVKVPTVQEGYVAITINDTIQVILEIVTGEAKFNASGLDVGRYFVNATYLGSPHYGLQKLI